MDEPRRSPPPYPPLALRERGNVISVRQKPDQDAGWGTLQQPKPLELPRLGSAHLRTRLGYEAEPSTEVWSFTAVADLRLQVTRRSSDRYANCVAVALVNGDNRPVVPLVDTAGGIGRPQTVPAGFYKLVVSLGVAEQVQVELELSASPAITLQARAGAVAGGVGALLQKAALLGRSWITAGGSGALLARRLLSGVASSSAGGVGALLTRGLSGRGEMGAGGQALLRLGAVAPLQGMARQAVGGRAAVAAVVVLDEPDAFWRARRRGAQLEINRAYFQSSDVALARQQLQDAGL